MRIKISRIIRCAIVMATSLCISEQSRAQDADLAAHRLAILKQVNEYRASAGLPALHRWQDGEPCADNGAKRDSESNSPHGSMGSCGQIAQNTCPYYPSIASVASTCLQQMWNEGAPTSQPCTGSCYMQHGHYINMTGNYIKLATGIHQLANGQVWVNMNFK